VDIGKTFEPNITVWIVVYRTHKKKYVEHLAISKNKSIQFTSKPYLKDKTYKMECIGFWIAVYSYFG